MKFFIFAVAGLSVSQAATTWSYEWRPDDSASECQCSSLGSSGILTCVDAAAKAGCSYTIVASWTGDVEIPDFSPVFADHEQAIFKVKTSFIPAISNKVPGAAVTVKTDLEVSVTAPAGTTCNVIPGIYFATTDPTASVMAVAEGESTPLAEENGASISYDFMNQAANYILITRETETTETKTTGTEITAVTTTETTETETSGTETTAASTTETETTEIRTTDTETTTASTTETETTETNDDSCDLSSNVYITHSSASTHQYFFRVEATTKTSTTITSTTSESITITTSESITSTTTTTPTTATSSESGTGLIVAGYAVVLIALAVI